MRLLISWTGVRGFPHQSIAEVETLDGLNKLLEHRGVKPEQVVGVREIRPDDEGKWPIMAYESLHATPPRD